MSGHNRWSTIKHKKAAADAKKSKNWTKLIKEISIAARSGGDPGGNPRLRTAIDKARGANIPTDTIDRAIKKGTGELGADSVEELVYQAYGPGGVAIVIELATDNRNRTAAELRKLLERQNAKIDPSGSVLHKFKKRGQILFDAEKQTEDAVTEVALEAGADDVRAEGDTIVVLTEPGACQSIKEAFEKKGMTPIDAEVGMLPELTVALNEKDAELIGRLVAALEEHEDVMNVYTNHEEGT
ncbi:MAG TPA: YebC/PmpR family DNA-binding transcriptional regulator [Pseudomonadota bacterium]|jgi:YebC/PmpR family DNA-binding regulatory protein|nr:YebC/PmpR family DNA-binding transcriptional regulator [Pseudomonadota bacterium]